MRYSVDEPSGLDRMRHARQDAPMKVLLYALLFAVALFFGAIVLYARDYGEVPTDLSQVWDWISGW